MRSTSMHEETVYEALDHAHGGEGQWAFGTGFDEPLAGVDTTVPEGIDPADLGAYCLMLGDDALVLAQRLTQWVTASPALATDSIPDEDALAFFRDADEFANTPLVEAPNGDFGQTMVRLLVASTVRLAGFAPLRGAR